jgi:predicted transposase YbfD/YdcC
VRRRLGGLHSAKIALYSVDFAEIEALQHKEDWEAATAEMISAARRVAAAGADCLVICTNTMHRMAEQVASAINIPLLHIADTTANRLVADGVHQVTSIGMVEAIREVGGKVSKEVRYFISSIQADAKKFANAVRSHWGIENSLHWVLDVTFNEDQCRVRRDLAAENLALLRKIALNILKADTTTKMSIRKKRKMSVWDDNYMLHLLTQKTETAQNMGI